jgi:hypothetical protein
MHLFSSLSKVLTEYKCAIPVFEGLLPKKHDRIVQKLLFELSTWHGLAKLRLHTESTVTDLENSTVRLGKALRDFSGIVCPTYATYDLPSEEAARVRRKAAADKKAKSQSSEKIKKKSTHPPTLEKKKAALTKSKGGGPASQSTSRRHRLFNLSTYKLHSLGWYPRAIRLFGATDNYNTQTVRFLPLLLLVKTLLIYLFQGELEHRRVKRFYKRIRKGKHVIGIGLQVRRERLIHRLKERNKHSAENLPTVPLEVTESLSATMPSDHYQISSDTRQKVQLLQWLKTNETDPAVQVFTTHYSIDSFFLT